MSIRFTLPSLLLAAVLILHADSLSPEYAAAEVCSKCHQGIFAAQTTTAMANTWKGQSGGFLPLHFDEKKLEGSDPALQYEVRRVGDKVEFSLVSGNATKATLPVEVMVGGKRHGISFLVRLMILPRFPEGRRYPIDCTCRSTADHTLTLDQG